MSQIGDPNATPHDLSTPSAASPKTPLAHQPPASLLSSLPAPSSSSSSSHVTHQHPEALRATLQGQSPQSAAATATSAAASSKPPKSRSFRGFNFLSRTSTASSSSSSSAPTASSAPSSSAQSLRQTETNHKIEKLKTRLSEVTKELAGFERANKSSPVALNTEKTHLESEINKYFFEKDRQELLSATSTDPVVQQILTAIKRNDKQASIEMQKLQALVIPGSRAVAEDTCIRNCSQARINDSQGADIMRYLKADCVQILDESGRNIFHGASASLTPEDAAKARFTCMIDYFCTKAGLNDTEKKAFAGKLEELQSQPGSEAEKTQLLFNLLRRGELKGADPSKQSNIAHMMQLLSQALLLTPVKNLSFITKALGHQMHPRDIGKSIQIHFDRDGVVRLTNTLYMSEKVKDKSLAQQAQENSNGNFQFEPAVELKVQTEMVSQLGQMNQWTCTVSVSVGQPPTADGASTPNPASQPLVDQIKTYLTYSGFIPQTYVMPTKTVWS